MWNEKNVKNKKVSIWKIGKKKFQKCKRVEKEEEKFTFEIGNTVTHVLCKKGAVTKKFFHNVLTWHVTNWKSFLPSILPPKTHTFLTNKNKIKTKNKLK